MRSADRAASRFAVMRLATLGLGLVGAFYTAARLGIEDYGVYAAGAALVPLVGALGLAGLDQLYLRGSFDLHRLRSLLTSWACVWTAVGVAIAAGLPSLPPEAKVVATLLMATYGAEIARSWWLLEPQRRGRLGTRARREFLYRTLLLMASIVFVTVWPTALGAAVAPATVAALFLLAVRSKSPEGVSPAENPRLFQALRQAAGYSASGAAYTVYMSVPSLSVALFAGTHEAGAFRIAFVVYGAMAVVPIALNNDAMRADLYRNAGNPDGFGWTIARFKTLNLRAVAITVIVGLIVSSFGIRLVLGPAYSAAEAPAILLCAAAPFHFANSYLGNIAVGETRLREVTSIQSAAALLSLLACPISASLYGGTGTAAAMILVEAGLAFGYFFTRRRREGTK